MLIRELYKIESKFYNSERKLLEPEEGAEIDSAKVGLGIISEIEIDEFIQEVYLNLTGNLKDEIKLNYIKLHLFPFVDYLLELRFKLLNESSKLNKKHRRYYFLAAGSSVIGTYMAIIKKELKKLFDTINLSIKNSKVHINIEKMLDKIQLDYSADEVENHRKLKIKEKFIFLKEIGGLENKIFKDLSQNQKKMVVSKILGCNEDYARDLINSHYSDYNKGKDMISNDLISSIKSEIKRK